VGVLHLEDLPGEARAAMDDDDLPRVVVREHVQAPDHGQPIVDHDDLLVHARDPDGSGHGRLQLLDPALGDRAAHQLIRVRADEDGHLDPWAHRRLEPRPQRLDLVLVDGCGQGPLLRDLRLEPPALGREPGLRRPDDAVGPIGVAVDQALQEVLKLRRWEPGTLVADVSSTRLPSWIRSWIACARRRCIPTWAPVAASDDR
jgi:hypothetical protein